MKFEKTEVFNIEGALRGMRNSHDSWDKADSYWDDKHYEIGWSDERLAKKLTTAGTSHRKYLRQIFVCVDITAPRYWWSEFDTYKVGTVSNSTSTMHTIMKKPFTLDMFEVDSKTLIDDKYEHDMWHNILSDLNTLRDDFLRTNDQKYFYRLKKRLPESFLQKRTITMSYENVLAMYHDRKNHRLPEWSVSFVKWVESLPYIRSLGVIEG